MAPEEELFNRGIELARRMVRDDKRGYWSGYRAGLMRAFFGELAISDCIHAALSDPDAAGVEGLGYRDGYLPIAYGRDPVDAGCGARRITSALTGPAHLPQTVRDFDGQS